jgi:hypothetical protein
MSNFLNLLNLLNSLNLLENAPYLERDLDKLLLPAQDQLYPFIVGL